MFKLHQMFFVWLGFFFLLFLLFSIIQWTSKYTRLLAHLEASLKAVNRKHHEKMPNRIRVCRRLAFHPVSTSFLMLFYYYCSRKQKLLEDGASCLWQAVPWHTWKHLIFLPWRQLTILVRTDQLVLWKYSS